MCYRNLSGIFLTFVFVIPLLAGPDLNVHAEVISDNQYKEVRQMSAQPDFEEMMDKWKEFATPNENHRVLDPITGSWDYKIRWWMSPDAAPKSADGRLKMRTPEGQEITYAFCDIYIMDNKKISEMTSYVIKLS